MAENVIIFSNSFLLTGDPVIDDNVPPAAVLVKSQYIQSISTQWMKDWRVDSL